jgi:hypothetical protein
MQRFAKQKSTLSDLEQGRFGDALELLQSSFSYLELEEAEADQLAVEAVKETRRTRANLLHS